MLMFDSLTLSKQPKPEKTGCPLSRGVSINLRLSYRQEEARRGPLSEWMTVDGQRTFGWANEK